jgi:hypothetical protein
MRCSTCGAETFAGFGRDDGFLITTCAACATQQNILYELRKQNQLSKNAKQSDKQDVQTNEDGRIGFGAGVLVAIGFLIVGGIIGNHLFGPDTLGFDICISVGLSFGVAVVIRAASKSGSKAQIAFVILLSLLLYGSFGVERDRQQNKHPKAVEQQFK